jgi:hypothetical protein
MPKGLIGFNMEKKEYSFKEMIQSPGLYSVKSGRGYVLVGVPVGFGRDPVFEAYGALYIPDKNRSKAKGSEEFNPDFTNAQVLWGKDDWTNKTYLKHEHLTLLTVLKTE